MDMEYIREFMTLSETCNFQEASRKLFITNSTLSKHLQRMESELGHPLFERSTRKVSLTEYGKIFQKQCGKVLKSYDDALSEMNDEAASSTNSLSIGFMNSTFLYGLLDLILAFKNKYPEINLQLNEIDQPLRKSVFMGCQSEFVFSGSIDGLTPDIASVPYAEEELVLFVPEDSPFAGKDSVRFSDLGDQPLIFPGAGFLQDLLFQACEEEEFTPNIKMYTRSSQIACKLAASNYAYTVFPRIHLQDYTGEIPLKVVPFSPSITFQIYLLYRNTTSFTRAGKLFYDYLTAEKH